MDTERSLETAALPAEIARQLPALRKKYGGDLVYIPAFEVVLRPYTRQEVISSQLNEANGEIFASRIALLKACLVFPLWETLETKVSIRDFSAIYGALQKASGFNDMEAFVQDLDKMRTFVQQWDHVIIRHICRAFPGLLPKQVNKMNRSDILYHLAQAEYITGYTWQGESLEEIAQQLEANARKERILAAKEDLGMGSCRAKREYIDLHKEQKSLHES